MNTISQAGINLIKQFEGCRLKAYKPVPTERFWTIGYGHYGADVPANMVIDQNMAEYILRQDLHKFETKVNKYDAIYHWTQNEFDALVSFAFNIGSIDQLTANGTRTRAQIRSKITSYNKAGGAVLAGLKRRREAEKAMFGTSNEKIEKIEIPVYKTPEKNYNIIVDEVLAGKWGNGGERKRKLEEAGYDYSRVQKLVNFRLKGGN